jgi:hypothetical protein
MFLFAESAPLAEGRARAHHTRTRPLFFIPPAAILRGGALSGTFQPNGSRRKDMTITADFSRRGLCACHRVATPLSVGLEIPVRRDALSLSPLCMPKSEPGVAQVPSRGLPAGRFARRASIPSPGLSAGLAL